MTAWIHCSLAASRKETCTPRAVGSRSDENPRIDQYVPDSSSLPYTVFDSTLDSFVHTL